MSAAEKTFCSVCAWRKTCQKRFTMKDRICPDFTRDLSLPREEEEENKKEDHEGTNTENH